MASFGEKLSQTKKQAYFDKNLIYYVSNIFINKRNHKMVLINFLKLTLEETIIKISNHQIQYFDF